MDRLKELRVEKHETQATISELLGITRGAYTNIENGRRSPDIDSLKTLADHYSVSIDYILERTNNKKGIAMFTMSKEERMEYAREYAGMGDDEKRMWLIDQGKKNAEAIVPGEYARFFENEGVSDVSSLIDDEGKLLALYRGVNPDGQRYILQQAEFANSREEYRLSPAPTAKSGA